MRRDAGQRAEPPVRAWEWPNPTGFVALDVSKEKVASPLTSLLTTGATPADRVLDDPAVLVFQSPNTLFVRLNGWTDRDLVAQAAENALAAVS